MKELVRLCLMYNNTLKKLWKSIVDNLSINRRDTNKDDTWTF